MRMALRGCGSLGPRVTNLRECYVDMKRTIKIDFWPRKEHYLFFKDFDEPFFGITAQVDCTGARQASLREGHSFFLSYLHKALTSVNETEAFRIRIEGEEVVMYDRIHASPTVGRPDGTFGFAYMDYHPDFETFAAAAQQEIKRVQGMSGLCLGDEKPDVIHFSSIPWIHFSDISHARHLSLRDSVPKITFGKMIEQNERYVMPVSVHAHHGLMDAWHVGLFLERFADLLKG